MGVIVYDSWQARWTLVLMPSDVRMNSRKNGGRKKLPPLNVDEVIGRPNPVDRLPLPWSVTMAVPWFGYEK